MLNKNFRYIALDFETTGLDPKKDEAIQIGLAEIDVNGKIIKEFKSFLKPQKDIKELKDFVAYITGISLDDLQEAPSIFDLQKEIFDFLGENVILIGHNIQFDIDFLKKYFQNIKYYDQIDTMYLAQNFVHFAPSYALDVLVEYLFPKKEFKKNFQNIHQIPDFDSQSTHDALFDSKNSLCLFVYIVQDILFLIKTYPILSNFIQKNLGLYHKILNYKVDRASKKNWKLELPKLEKQFPGEISLKSKDKINLRELKHKGKYFIGNVDIDKIIATIVGSNKTIILSFASVAKLNIVKNILNDMGMKNIGFVRGNLIINKTKFNTFLNKESFSDNELLFIFKYMSHVRHKMSILDLNTKFDFKINYYIQDDKKNKKYPVILTTHLGLFTILNEKKHIYYKYDICFFDPEMWYRSYNSFLSNNYDLYSSLNFLETLYYKYTLNNQESTKELLENFARFFEVFMGVLFAETKKHFVNIQDNYITLNPIIDHINFHETNALIKQFDKHKTLLEADLDSEDFKKLWGGIDKMFNILSGLVQINKIMYGQSDFYFTYGEATNFTNRDEFADIFASHTLFLSNFDKSCNKIMNSNDIEYTKYNLNFKKIGDIDNVISFLNKELSTNSDKTFFVISTIKLESKELFEKIYEAGLDQKALLLVENITGSLGKNIFKAKNNGPKIIVGGYNFFIRLLSNKINIDICVDFNIKGKLSEYLLNDMQRYAKYKK
ncbi:MAG TPA: exonuclease domain-containing protein [Candidatus Absconditabacterales bacterium]|nr:exonuclease domain-containing protein [Candidatus Absconditabacterales bacterium]HOQ78782.1 exonuclease domain-containing protein [Candidatus Absconditabacterales bacterium]HPK27597.1 exonuclease domain-containing protein [Candidatus Absconditabacterales bacterium]